MERRGTPSSRGGPAGGPPALPEQVLGESPDPASPLWENDGVRLWNLPARDARIGIVSFKSKMHAIGNEVLDGCSKPSPAPSATWTAW